MTFEILVVLVLLVLVFGAFIWERFPPEVVALSASAVLLATGILETKEFLTVFSSSAPITIAMMFIVSAALERTGVLDAIGRMLARSARGSDLVTLALMMLFVILASAFMNNTPLVILMTPVAISLAAGLGIAPSRFLIPLSFSAIFGGTLTLVGTSTNILMSTVAERAGQPAIGMFEMTLPGLIFAAVGMLYMILAGRFFLPDRVSLAALMAARTPRRFIAEILIPHDSRYIGRTAGALPLGSESASVIDVIRARTSLRDAMLTQPLAAGDRIVFKTGAGQLVGLRDDGQIAFSGAIEDYEPVTADKTVLIEASIGTGSSLIGRKLSAIALRRKYGVYPIALHRNDENIDLGFDDIRLRFADTLLLEGPAEGIRRLLDEGDVINLSKPREKPVRSSRAPIAIAVVLAIMALATVGVMPIEGLALIGAVVLMLTGCIDPDEAFESIDWRILFLIFGMLGLSMGMEKTGAAALVVQFVVAATRDFGPVAVLLAIYVLASALTEMISNNAVAILLGPIAIGLANQLGLDPRPFIFAVMFAASASFATPIGYQTNTFVYGAGGYRFMDFVKVGLPLNILFAILAAFVFPAFYPFHPG